MKNTSISEIIGFSLILIGFVFMLLEGMFEEGLLSQIIAQYQIFYWIGLIIWSLGYMKRVGVQKK